MQFDRDNHPSNRCGLTIVECAVAIPIIFVCIVVQLNFNRTTTVRHALRSACHTGCRAALVRENSREDVRAEVASTLRDAGITEFELTVTPSDLNQSTVNLTITIAASTSENSWLPRLFSPERILKDSLTVKQSLKDEKPVVRSTIQAMPEDHL